MTEAQLRVAASIERIEQLQRLPPVGSADVDFGLSDSWEEVEARLRELLTRLAREMAAFVWVDTVFANGGFARTSVGYRSNTQTVVSRGLRPDQAEHHAAAVGTAIWQRVSLLRIAIAAARTATALSRTVSVPALAPAGIRNAWMLVRELERWQAGPTGKG